MSVASSPAKEVDITSLEMAFAKDPASEAFLDLSEAYLAQSRYMEAMVVCKKGIKSNPDSRDGRLLLARIFSQQGKLPKALIELSALVEAHPDFAAAHLHRGKVLDQQGETDAAVEAFKQALGADPHLEEARAALKEKGVEYTPPAPILEETPPSGSPLPGADDTRPAIPAQTSADGAPQSAPRPVARPVAPRVTYDPNNLFDGSHFDPNQGLQESKARGAGVTLGIVAAGIAVLGVLLIWLYVHATNLRKIDALNTDALKLISQDTYKQLEEAAEKTGEVLSLDDKQSLALGMRAFAYVVRTVDHGVQREDLNKVQPALDAAKEHSETSWRYAAEVTYMYTNGDAKGAIEKGKQYVEKGFSEVQNYVALAGAALADGDIQISQEALKQARDKGPYSVRAKVASADFFRRMMQNELARKYYTEAVKTEPNHAGALAGRAMLVLEDPTASNLFSAAKDWETIRDIGRTNIGPKVWARAKAMDAFFNQIQGNDEKADQAIDEAQRTSPEDADVFYVVARVYMMKKKSTEAIAALNKSQKLDGARLPTYLALARLYNEAGETSKANAALSSARRLDSGNSQILLAEASSKRKEGKYDEALSLLEKAKKEHGDKSSIALERLEIHLMANDAAKVKEEFTNIEKLWGGDPTVMTRALVHLGRNILEERDNERAAEAFREAIKRDAKNADAHYYLAYALRADRASRAEAIGSLKTYLELAPTGPNAKLAQKILDRLE